jgi:hypothetical protein
MNRPSSLGAEHRRHPALAARVSAIAALMAAVAVIVAVLLFAHSSGEAVIHSIRPLPQNFFGH